MSEFGNRPLLDGNGSFRVGFSLRNDLVGRGWCGSHEKTWRRASPEHLGPFLEINVAVTSDIDIPENIFNNVELGEFLAGLSVQFLQHFMEFLEI